MSLAVCANILRVFSGEGVRQRDLPRLTGVSKEAIAMALGLLTKYDCVFTEPEAPGSRMKLLSLTPRGVLARQAYPRLIRIIEEGWQGRYGTKTIQDLRASLQPVVGDGTREESPLFAGLEPHPDGWRAKIPRPEVLPHYPMVLHRGGWPDGS